MEYGQKNEKRLSSQTSKRKADDILPLVMYNALLRMCDKKIIPLNQNVDWNFQKLHSNQTLFYSALDGTHGVYYGKYSTNGSGKTKKITLFKISPTFLQTFDEIFRAYEKLKGEICLAPQFFWPKKNEIYTIQTSGSFDDMHEKDPELFKYLHESKKIRTIFDEILEFFRTANRRGYYFSGFNLKHIMYNRVSRGNKTSLQWFLYPNNILQTKTVLLIQIHDVARKNFLEHFPAQNVDDKADLFILNEAIKKGQERIFVHAQFYNYYSTYMAAILSKEKEKEDYQKFYTDDFINDLQIKADEFHTLYYRIYTNIEKEYKLKISDKNPTTERPDTNQTGGFYTLNDEISLLSDNSIDQSEDDGSEGSKYGGTKDSPIVL